MPKPDDQGQCKTDPTNGIWVLHHGGLCSPIRLQNLPGMGCRCAAEAAWKVIFWLCLDQTDLSSSRKPYLVLLTGHYEVTVMPVFHSIVDLVEWHARQ